MSGRVICSSYGPTGAYGYVMASNYNARPRPAEVLVDAGAIRDRDRP